MRIYNKHDIKTTKEYNHNCKITSAINVNEILVVGDERGKITLLYDYLTEKKNKKIHKVQSIL